MEVLPSTKIKKDYLLSNEMLVDQGDYLDFVLSKKEKIKGTLTLAVKGSQAISLPQAPFGGFWTEEMINSETAEFFISQVEELLKSRGVKSLTIHQAPKPYQRCHDLFSFLLFQNGYVAENMSAHQFFIGKKKIKKLSQHDHAKFTKKLSQGSLELYCGAIQNFTFLQQIRDWNRSKGYEVNLQESRLIYQVSEFPERYFLITLSRDGVAIAHTLAVKLTQDSLYYYQSAIDPKVTLKNLGDLLLMRLFQLAVDEKVEFIDLGTSELSTGANHSLMFFKSRFSNDISTKLTWTKSL